MGALSDDVAPLFPVVAPTDPPNMNVEPLFKAVI